MSEIPFTPDQLDAADVRQRHLDACVVAGPGSGKTTVLVEYFKRLVEAGVDPLRILAITFTEKAAANMRDKLAKVFRDDAAIRGKLERSWVSTVHGFCTRLLKENAVFAGIDPEFTVADETESWRLQQESIAEAMDELLAEHKAAMQSLIRGLSSYEFEEAVLSAYDAMRGAGVRVSDLAEFRPPAGTTVRDIAETLRALRAEPVLLWKPSQKDQLQSALEGAQRVVSAPGPGEALKAVAEFSVNRSKCKKGNNAYELLTRLQEQMDEVRYALITQHYAPQRKTLIDILTRFDRIYRDKKRRAGQLDFGDMEEFTVRLLEEHTDTRARVQGQFDHILMDEFQDTNPQQTNLIKLVRSPQGFYAVGDINQSIFGFRHAEPAGFAEYQEDIAACGGHMVELTDNFRSRAAVLAAVETIAAGASGIVPRPLVAHRKFDTERDCCVEARCAADLKAEAGWVARRIGELAAEGFEYRQVAVLVRNTEVIAEFTAAFDEAGVPYVVNRGKGFYETREVNDLTQLLRVIANPRDEVSLAAVLRSPLVGASDEALLGLKSVGEKPNLGGSLMGLGDDQSALFSVDDYARLRRFRERIRAWRARREYVTFDRLLLEALDDCAYQPEAGARGWANIDKFLSQARSAARRMSLDAFVDELAQLRKSNPREADAPPEDSADAVQVMTVHSAKGLEFPVVFVAALHKGVQGDPPVVAFSREFGLGARWRLPGTREDKDDLFEHALRSEWKKRESDESDRLLYVAMTRAEEVLVLSWSGERPKEWAKAVAACLSVNCAMPQDQVKSVPAPRGEQWQLRVVVGEVPGEAAKSDAAATPAVRIHTQAPATQVELVSAPAITEQQDANATVTALAKFASCPREYSLGNYLGFEGRQRKLAEGDGELSAGDFGTQVHTLLAGDTVAEPDDEALRLVSVFRASPLGKRAARASRIEREFDFLMLVEGLVVRGQVDLWFEEGGELVIVDYKTDAVTAVQAHQRAQDYELQVRLYALAVERVAGRAPDRAWLHFLKPNTVIEVDLTPSLLDSPEQVVRDFQEAQDRAEFPLRESERCVRCPFYKDLCPAGT